MSKVVILDVGHRKFTFPRTGGKGVYVNGHGYAEFDFNDKLARSIRGILVAHGIKVIMEANYANKAESLIARTNFYNKQKADLGLSIHANASGSKNVNGRCAFYWHTSSKAKRFASNLAAEWKRAGYSTHGSGLHESKLGSWTNLHMVRETNTPFILAEHGFMTGNEDFELIFGSKQSKYIQDMAIADSKAILRYFDMSYNGKQNPEKEKETSKNDDLYRVQVGAYGQKENADKIAKELKDKGYDTLIKREGKSKNEPIVEAKPKHGQIKVDGIWGKGTTRALQKALGSIEDGIISGQYRNSVTESIYGAEYGKGGSLVIRKLQTKIGATVDGYIGKKTIIKLQQYLGTIQDGIIGKPYSKVVAEMQRRLNVGTF